MSIRRNVVLGFIVLLLIVLALSGCDALKTANDMRVGAVAQVDPTTAPTNVPPTAAPTTAPTNVPPTAAPTIAPTTVPPTAAPTIAPTAQSGSGARGNELNACTSVDLLQVTPLVENSNVVPNAFMFLDKNEAEVEAGDLWQLTLPENAYAQYFRPKDGETYEAVGPIVLHDVGALTVWCDNAEWLKSQDFAVKAGSYRNLDARNLPNPDGEWKKGPHD